MNPEDLELERKKKRRAELEVDLAERELELASLRAELATFERTYLSLVGRRYAQLDELNAKIAKFHAELTPESKVRAKQAKVAQFRAEESARATSEQGEGGAQQKVRPEGLRDLYRKAAKAVHPDLSLDGDERKRRHVLMAEINDAYKKGDVNRIKKILEEWQSRPEEIKSDSPGAELVRVIRQIAQVERRLTEIAATLEQFRQSELFLLRQGALVAKEKGRDLLKEMAEDLDAQIAERMEVLKLLRKRGPL